MSNDPKDFVGTLRSSNNTISGIKGHLETVKIGTVRWYIQDDDSIYQILTWFQTFPYDYSALHTFLEK